MRTDYSQAIVACIHDRQGIVAHIVHHDEAPSRERQRTIENQDGTRPDGGALYNPYLPDPLNASPYLAAHPLRAQSLA